MALDDTKKTIWIDVDNSPHVPLFAPIIRYYHLRGVDVILTAREHSQTLELLELQGFSDIYTIIGRHHGKYKLNKIIGTLGRAHELASHLKKQIKNGSKPAVAISHGSRAMVLAAWWLQIPVISMYDYEFNETMIFNHLSTRVLVPERIPDAVLDEIGLPVKKRFKYPGIKEELYVNEFCLQSDFRRKFLESNNLQVSDKVLVVLRPPATTANYHVVGSEELFDKMLRRLLDDDDAFTIIVPRTEEQSKEIEANISRLNVPGSNYLSK